MATRRRRGISKKKSDKQDDLTEDEISASAASEEDNDVFVKGEGQNNDEGTEEEASMDEDDKSGSDSDQEMDPMRMSLDVLAQVAADRLEKDPGPSSRSKSALQKKVQNMSKRSLLNMDFLHLDQIRTLSPKFLVNLFAEMYSNEITRNYSYTCYIMPEKCNTVYSSFGSEIRARDLIKSHLQKHVEDLVRLKTANEGFSFIAETVVAKKKREIAEKNMRKRKAWNVGISKISKKAALKPPSKSKSSNSKKIIGNKSTKVKSKKSDRDQVHVNVSIIKKPRAILPASTTTATTHSLEGDFPMILSEDAIPVQESSPGDENTEDDVKAKIKRSKADGEWDIIDDKIKVPFKRTGRNVARNEKIIWDILCESQPYHDHSYTTVFGKRKAGQAFEEMELLEMDEELDDETRPTARTSGLKFSMNSSVDPDLSPEPGPVAVKIGDKVEKKLHIPMVRVEFSAPNPLNDKDAVTLISPDVMGHTVNRPYPPMPKSDLAQKGRMEVPEEEAYSSEDDPAHSLVPVTTSSNTSTSAVISPSKKKDKRKIAEGTFEWERRLALKCIRELRMRKKEEDTRLVCKICKDKTFTATATLMYHYRSHAGIKPFVCLICNTTFTRQHSLNYHMLIHNNQSRFTCVDCGRKFRHPSHFKEHLRRHTGETPFHCMDCPLRFKTRNTYKRHLKTRHGKLLTANGIRIMPREEFLKVRSKYAKKEGKQPEDEDFDEDDEDDEDEILVRKNYENLPEDELEGEAEIDLEGIDSDDKDSASGEGIILTNLTTVTTPGALYATLPISQSATVTAIPVPVPADQNLSALSDTSASNKLLQLCSQVVKQEAG